jgi:hypothetical protein
MSSNYSYPNKIIQVSLLPIDFPLKSVIIDKNHLDLFDHNASLRKAQKASFMNQIIIKIIHSPSSHSGQSIVRQKEGTTHNKKAGYTKQVHKDDEHVINSRNDKAKYQGNIQIGKESHSVL